MANLLFVITSDTYVRNYLRTNALSEVRKHHHVLIVAERSIKLASEVQTTSGFIDFYDLDENAERKHQLLFDLRMWRNRHKSRTFFFRWLRNSNWQLIRRDGALHIRALSYLHWFVAALLNRRGLRIPILANRIIFPFVSKAISRNLKPNESLRQILLSRNFDAVLFPSAAFDSVSEDLPALCKELEIPSICLIDNWDNLSSKTVFSNKPSYLGVWGPQARIQAIEIHGFKEDEIFEVGTPRFDVYFVKRRKPPRAPYSFPYALFVGSAMPFDDIGALRALDKILESSPGFPSEFRVVYRPHPWQQKRNSQSDFLEQEFSSVVLDRQFRELSKADPILPRLDSSFQPELDYYPGLLFGSRFVVGPLTTMLFEASLCQKPVVALSYFDGYHANTSKRYFSHFDGMEKVPGFIFCENPESLGASVKMANNLDPLDMAPSDNSTAFFLRQDEDPYAKRLLNLVSAACQS